MEGCGYWTDASSLDALSTCSDAEDGDKDRTIGPLSFGGTITPTFDHSKSRSGSREDLLTTPTNNKLTSVTVPHEYPSTCYISGEELRTYPTFMQALRTLGLDPIFIDEDDFSPSCIDCSTSTVVFATFSGQLFDTLRKRPKLRIYGPPVLYDLAVAMSAMGTRPVFPLSRSGYPIYARFLRNCKICATGLRSRDELVEMRRRILYLDGVFLEREGPIMTHLVAARCRGNKYRDAVALDKPILKPQWINFLWENRNQRDFDLRKDIGVYKVRSFFGARIALEGFDQSEKTGMIKLIEENEGIYVESGDPNTTHIVRSNCGSIQSQVVSPPGLSFISPSPMTSSTAVSSLSTPLTTPGNCTGAQSQGLRSPLKRARWDPVVNDLPETPGCSDVDGFMGNMGRALVLRAEWFWTSIQIEACADEKTYLLRDPSTLGIGDETLNNSIGTPNSLTSPPMYMNSDTDGTTPTPLSASRRKRKRQMRDLVSSLAVVESASSIIMEVDAEDEEAGDGVKSPEHSEQNVDDAELAAILKRIDRGLQSQDLRTKMTAAEGKALKRLNEFVHLVDTERNYVTILMHIIKLFKVPCEADDQKAGRVLTPVEIKNIFGPILPIYELHKRILRDMLHILENYSEESLIGQIYVKNAEELRKCYEPFVGYFEAVKNEIIRCENENPRFMAFLRIAQAKPQLGREKLVELIIRPVQRLPSTALVLKNLEKNTEKTHPDFEWTTKGVEAIDRVNQTINQKKERADARVAIFDVYHEIEGCPVELISDHRSLLKKYDVVALHYDVNATSTTSYKNEGLTLIVFSDHFQVVKRRSLASTRGGAGGTLSMANLRSPAVSRKSMKFGGGLANAGQKRYKFIEWINFCHVKKVVNVHDSDPRSFALIVREPEDLRERVLQFTLPEDFELEKVQKLSVVEFFAKQVAHSVTRVDFEQFITTVDSSALNGNHGSSGGFISRGIKKVGRALSLSRTPSRLKRTMSQIINSPFRGRGDKEPRDPDSVSQNSENSFTPIRNHLSTISLFGTKRGSMMNEGQSTPKTRKGLLESCKDKPKFAAIEET